MNRGLHIEQRRTHAHRDSEEGTKRGSERARERERGLDAEAGAEAARDRGTAVSSRWQHYPPQGMPQRSISVAPRRRRRPPPAAIIIMQPFSSCVNGHPSARGTPTIVVHRIHDSTCTSVHFVFEIVPRSHVCMPPGGCGVWVVGCRSGAIAHCGARAPSTRRRTGAPAPRGG